MREIVMQLRTTIVITLCNAGCIVDGTLGDEPMETNGETAVASDDETSGDGHTSQTAGDASATTTAGESTDAGESTTGENPNALCEHPPSGAAPGSVEWSVGFGGFTPVDFAASSTLAMVVGTTMIDGAFARVTLDGQGLDSAPWSAPVADVTTVARHVVALPDDRFAAAFDAVEEGDCEWCVERWLVMFGPDGTIEWEQSFGEGSWAIAAMPAGTIAIVDVTADDPAFLATVREVDVFGTELRADSEHGTLVALVRSAAAGPLGDVIAVGHDVDPEIGWTARWGSDMAFNWAAGGPGPRHAIAYAANGEVVEGWSLNGTFYLSRREPEIWQLWNTEIDMLPLDVATDCDDSIVVASSGSVSRHDGTEGAAMQWSTPIDGTAVAVATVAEGGVIALVDNGGYMGELIRFAGL